MMTVEFVFKLSRCSWASREREGGMGYWNLARVARSREALTATKSKIYSYFGTYNHRWAVK
jgi:hypothetical protein